MALAEAAKLIATLDLGGNFVKNLGGADRALGKFDSHIDRSQSKAFQAGQHIGLGIKNAAVIAAAGVGILATNVGLGLRSLVELEQQQAQTNAVLKSTKGAAGISAQAVGDLAEKYESLNAIIGDEVIRSTENMLLTFTNIKGKAFEPALKAILDINTAMGGGPEGLQKVAIQVGKALNDPAKGLTALTRIGVTFDKQQVKRIKQLQKEGKVYEAQQIILQELNREFGGSFIAQGNTTAGKVAKFTDAIEDLQRALATALLPAVKNVADALATFLSDPQTIRDVQKFGQSLAKFLSPENIRAGIALIKSGFNAIKTIATPILAVVEKVVAAFRALPPDVQKFLIGAVALNKLTGGGVIHIVSDVGSGFGSILSSAVASGITKGGAIGLGAALTKAGLGKFFVQPVFVTNPGFGGGGGLPNPLPAAAGAGVSAAGLLANATVALAPVTVAAIGLAVDQAVDPNDSLKAIAAAETAMGHGIADWNNRGIATLKDIATNTGDPKAIKWLQDHGIDISGGGIESLRGAIIAGINAKPPPNQHTPGDTQAGIEAHRGQIGDALFEAMTHRLDVIAANTFNPTVKLDPSQITDLRQDQSFDAIEKLRTEVATTSVDTVDGIEAMRGDISSGIDNTKVAIDNAKSAVESLQGVTSAGLNDTSTAARTAGFTAANASYGAARGIETAIANNRPIINVDVSISATTIDQTVTVTDRNGPSGGSATDDYRNGMGAG